jgi:hypothetical protein
MLGGEEAGRLVSWEAVKLGGWKANKAFTPPSFPASWL